MHNGGAYGDGTAESGAGIECGAAGTTGKYGQFPFASGGTGDSGADRFAERGGKDEPTHCPAIGTDQRDRGQMAATLRGAGCGGAARRVAPRAAPPGQPRTGGPGGAQDRGAETQRRAAMERTPRRKPGPAFEI